MKPPRYRDFGVPEYWVVDPEQRRIEVHRLAADAAPEPCAEVVRWQPDGTKPALELRVGDVFAR